MQFAYLQINHALMDTLSDEEKQEWVDASPSNVFELNTVTRRVGVRAVLSLARSMYVGGERPSEHCLSRRSSSSTQSHAGWVHMFTALFAFPRHFTMTTKTSNLFQSRSD